jgi:protease YdgD
VRSSINVWAEHICVHAFAGGAATGRSAILLFKSGAVALKNLEIIFTASARLVFAVFIGSLPIIEPCKALAQSVLPGQESAEAAVKSGERVPIVPDQWPWSSIGRINLATTTQRSMCTGTLVGPRTVITAAHCLFDLRLNQWVKPNVVHFVAGLSPGMKYSGQSAVSNYFVSPDFKLESEGQSPNFQSRGQPIRTPMTAVMAKHDWAVLTLEDSLNLKPIPIQAVKDADLPGSESEAEIVLPGYGADRRELLAISRGCRAKTDLPGPGQGSLAHTCAIALGGSGSPVLLLQKQAATVIGVATAARIGRPDMPVLGGIGVSATEFEQAVSSTRGAALTAPRPIDSPDVERKPGLNVVAPSGSAGQTATSRKAEVSTKIRQPKAGIDDQRELERKLNICRGC